MFQIIRRRTVLQDEEDYTKDVSSLRRTEDLEQLALPILATLLRVVSFPDAIRGHETGVGGSAILVQSARSPDRARGHRCGSVASPMLGALLLSVVSFPVVSAGTVAWFIGSALLVVTAQLPTRARGALSTHRRDRPKADSRPSLGAAVQLPQTGRSC